MVIAPRSLVLAAVLALALSLPAVGEASSLYQEIKSKISGDAGAMTQADFEKMAMEMRSKAIERYRPPPVSIPTAPVVGFGKYPWHRNIMTTVFWIGERPTARNPVPNNKSSWDSNWARNYGGYDNPDPAYRRNFIPTAFTPRQNPFYIALPYCDISRGNTKTEAKGAIPWFRDAFVQSGKSVLKGRWLAIHHGGRTAFAQWEDCGPFRTDHWQYVFGNGSVRPKPNLNRGAGLDISPAIRDYLGMGKNDLCDWKFVEAGSVPDGPWKFYGDNNTFVLKRKGANLYQSDRNNAKGSTTIGSSIRPSANGMPLSTSPVGIRATPSVGIRE